MLHFTFSDICAEDNGDDVMLIGCATQDRRACDSILAKYAEHDLHCGLHWCGNPMPASTRRGLEDCRRVDAARGHLPRLSRALPFIIICTCSHEAKTRLTNIDGCLFLLHRARSKNRMITLPYSARSPRERFNGPSFQVLSMRLISSGRC
jgi:hypothetical protein